MKKKVKILATIGPSSSEKSIITKLIKEGADGARLNFSHGTHEDHKKNYDNLRKVAKENGKPLAILADLQGPKIRCGLLKDRRAVILKKENNIVLTVEDILGDADKISVTYKN